VAEGSPAQSRQERLNQAIAFKNEGQYEQAVAIFRGILEESPECVEARLGLGLVLCFMGEFDASLEELRRAVQDGPENVETHLNLAKTYAMLGMYEEAKVEFMHVLRLAPGHREAIKQLSYFNYSETGESSR
jgi:tetratricopeptide (TPR) repeat protein